MGWSSGAGWVGVRLLTSPVISGNVLPASNDGGAIGSATLSFSDLFLASGGVINWNNGDVTLTHSLNTLTVGGGTLALGSNAITSSGTLSAGATTLSGALAMGANAITGTAAITPSANDGGALGSATLGYSDLFLATGGVINAGNGNATITLLNGIQFGNAALSSIGDLSVGGVVAETSGMAAQRVLASISISLGATILTDSATAPTVSGFGTSPSVPNANGTAAFTINVGTGGTASTGTINLPTAATGWVVQCQDVTNPASFITSQTGGTTTTATVTNYDRATGLAIAWTASDVLRCSARAY